MQECGHQNHFHMIFIKAIKNKMIHLHTPTQWLLNVHLCGDNCVWEKTWANTLKVLGSQDYLCTFLLYAVESGTFQFEDTKLPRTKKGQKHIDWFAAFNCANQHFNTTMIFIRVKMDKDKGKHNTVHSQLRTGGQFSVDKWKAKGFQIYWIMDQGLGVPLDNFQVLHLSSVIN